jgi:hypothetical protein
MEGLIEGDIEVETGPGSTDDDELAGANASAGSTVLDDCGDSCPARRNSSQTPTIATTSSAAVSHTQVPILSFDIGGG